MKKYSARMFDSLISTGSRITTGMRINAEPAPEIRAGDMGVRHDGRSSAPQEQIELDAMVEQVAADLGLESPEDLAKIRAAFERFGGRPPRTQAGIATSDAAIANARRQIVGGIRDSAPVRAAVHAQVEVRRNADHLAAVSQGYADFWNKRLAEPDNR